MPKKIKSILKFSIIVGNPKMQSVLGPILGQHGVNVISFCNDLNTKTIDKKGKLRLKVTVYEDKSYSFILKPNSTSKLLLEYLNLEKGSKFKKEKIGTLTLSQIKEIALIKLNELTTQDIDKSIKIIEGTAKNMGIKIIK